MIVNVCIFEKNCASSIKWTLNEVFPHIPELSWIEKKSAEKLHNIVHPVDNYVLVQISVADSF